MSELSEKEFNLVEHVENLNEEVKEIAFNLAIHLAKQKKDSEQLKKMEPEFIKLVNEAVKAGQELSVLINAAKNKETMIYDVPTGKFESDHLERKLNSIVGQCMQILEDLGVKSDYEV